MNNILSKKYAPVLLCFGAALILSILLWINPIPSDDAATRYAPMARAFAEGNWRYAFHPHSGVLFSTLSGSIAWITNLDGFRSCQYAALLFWTLAALPLYAIVYQLWHDRKIALTVEILYFLCSHLQRYVYSGVRDNGRSLGFFLLVLGLLYFFDARKSWKPIFITATGGAILAMLRVDGFFFAIAGLLTFFIFDLRSNRWNCRRTLSCLLLFFLLMLPQLYLNYRWSGYPVPNSRYALLLEKCGIPPMRNEL